MTNYHDYIEKKKAVQDGWLTVSGFLEVTDNVVLFFKIGSRNMK